MSAPTTFVASCGKCGINYVFSSASERFEWTSGHNPDHKDFVSYFRCTHDSLSGDEGPVELLGRMPTRWRCDECGVVVEEAS